MMHTVRRMLQRPLLGCRPLRACAVLLSLALLPAGPVGVVAEAPPSGFQATMRDLFQALTAVFPVPLHAEQWQDPAQYPRMLAALRALAHHAEGLMMPG